MLSDELDCAHIKGKGSYPELNYDMNNIVLISRYFHTLLDQHRHPIFRHIITEEEKINWLKRAKKGLE